MEAKTASEPRVPKDRRTCECGCGETPKTAGARFLPGHDLRKAYQDQKVQQRAKDRSRQIRFQMVSMEKQ